MNALKIFIKASALLLSVVLVGCDLETEIEYNKKDAQPFLVVFSYLNPDSVFTAKTNIASPIMDTSSPKDLSDCEINIYENDVFVERLSFISSGNYRGTKTPEPGKRYKITVKKTGFETLEAETNLVKKPKVENLKLIQSTDGRSQIKFELNLIDPKETSNFYRLIAFIKITYKMIPDEILNPGMNSNQNIILEGNVMTKQIPLISDQAIFNGLDDGNTRDIQDEDFQNKLMIFKDDSFNGQNFVLKFESQESYSAEQENIENITYVFSLQNLNYDYYLFLKTQQEQFLANSDPFIEPIQVYTNIKNGAGIFTSYSSVELSQKLR